MIILYAHLLFSSFLISSLISIFSFQFLYFYNLILNIILSPFSFLCLSPSSPSPSSSVFSHSFSPSSSVFSHSFSPSSSSPFSHFSFVSLFSFSSLFTLFSLFSLFLLFQSTSLHSLLLSPSSLSFSQPIHPCQC